MREKAAGLQVQLELHRDLWAVSHAVDGGRAVAGRVEKLVGEIGPGAVVERDFGVVAIEQ